MFGGVQEREVSPLRVTSVAAALTSTLVEMVEDRSKENFIGVTDRRGDSAGGVTFRSCGTYGFFVLCPHAGIDDESEAKTKVSLQ